jgi:hypothetical protein
MTETLAKVYLEQKRYQKQYKLEILILKYPEKCSFFTDISDIKILQQNNN